MDSFIQLENFPKIAPYAELFWQGTVVTVLLALFYGCHRFLPGADPCADENVQSHAFPALGLDADGHPRETGFLAALSRFNPLGFIATAYVEILRFHTGTSSDLHHLLRRIQYN